jgi:hypothetical protein
VLAQVWKLDTVRARAIIHRLGDAQILRYATLENGSVWCVLNTAYAYALRHLHEEELPSLHASILAVYEDRPGFSGWPQLKDDGFIMLHVVQHLAANRRVDELRCAFLLNTHYTAVNEADFCIKVSFLLPM